VLELPAVTSVAIGSLDTLIVFGYLLATIALGVWLGRGQKTNRDYFLGGHQLPTWALLVSIVATETSTVTFLSVPGKTYVAGGNFTFLQLALGYIVGRFAIVFLLLPGYFRGEMLSAYQVLEQRFGITTRRLASLVFLVTRNIADGLRLYLSAWALNIAIGLDFLTCIIAMTVITAIYCVAGGVKSVVWNDCIQFLVYMAGAFATVWAISSQLPAGWFQISEFGHATGRWQMFDFELSLTKPGITFWSGLLGGAFLSLGTHGVDQMIVQRYLCAKNRASASWALALSGFIVFAQFALFLTIGVALACFYANFGTGNVPAKGDEAFMTYVVGHMNPGLRGLILAAVLAATMSNLSSSFNSSASALMADWLQRWMAKVDDRRSLRMARWLTLASAVVHALVAIYFYKVPHEQSIVDSVLTIASFAVGLLLGLYFLGLLPWRVSEPTALIAFCVGAVVTSFAFWYGVYGYWFTLVGSSTILVVGIVISLLFDRQKPQEAATAKPL
jgi:solute:Na+ symporter, SSS family